jgi:hypothetical protein
VPGDVFGLLDLLAIVAGSRNVRAPAKRLLLTFALATYSLGSCGVPPKNE